MFRPIRNLSSGAARRIAGRRRRQPGRTNGRLRAAAAAAGLLACGANVASAQHSIARDAGLGVIVGEPTGLSAKFWMGGSTAFDAAAAWSFVDQGAVHLHADILQHAFNVFGVDRGALPLYYGIGARLKMREDRDAHVGLRVPLGLEYIFESGGAGLFFEVAPVLDLAPESDVFVNGAAGFRYYFR